MGPLRAGEGAARDVLLLRAIESEDSGAVVLTRDDREFATAAAMASSRLSGSGNRAEKVSFLARRAEVALERLVARYPDLERVRKLSEWPHWLTWLLPLAALIIGLTTNIVEGRQFNIVAFPFLGMLAWNLAVYVWLLIGMLRRTAGSRGGSASHPILRLIEWVARPAGARLAAHPTLERAVARFARDWSAAAARLTRHRASGVLHASAAMFAVGIVAGLLARAYFTTEYRAGWERTIAGGEQAIALMLSIILGPASAITGKPLPGAQELLELRGTYENAADWVILWSVTAALFVIVPRLVLALNDGLRAAVLRRRLPVDEDFYVRRMFRNALGQTRSVRVIPYGFEVPQAKREQLERLLIEVLGDTAQVRSDASVLYGEEDEWLAREGEGLSAADQLILLFNLGSTPEAENHGAFAQGVRRNVGTRAELSVLLEESGFRHRFDGQPSAERRIEERLRAWKAVLAPAGLEPVRVSLEAADEAAQARALEQAMTARPVPA